MRKRATISDWRFSLVERTQKENILSLMTKNDEITSFPLNFSEFIVPGTIQSNIAEKEGLDPYYERNMEYFQKFEDKILILVSEVDIKNSDLRNTLLFDYIDTVCDIYLNGNLIKQTKSAHMIVEVDLPPDHVKKGLNQLILFIYPPLPQGTKTDTSGSFNERTLYRKPTFNYGWDFAPRSLTKGIGKVILTQKKLIEISDIFTYTLEIQNDQCVQFLKWEIDSEIEEEKTVSIQIFDPDNYTLCFSEESKYFIKKNVNKFNRKIVLKNPKLWWPNGYGQQPLYRLKLTIKESKTSMDRLFGIRLVNLILMKEDENRFTFEINNRMIYAKGANWVPTDALRNYSGKEKYTNLIRMAKNANFNMLRVWGGGVVERDEFYQLCDSMGVMIWHDFQFACSIYPETEEYLMQVELEVHQIIRRLRNHPSIVLWCGNNENEWIDYQKISLKERKEKKIGESLHLVKKRLCATLDPSRPYWRSSPWSPSSENDFTFDPNSQKEGNSHNWEVWHGVNQPDNEPLPYEHYKEFESKFVSEFGIQGFPSKFTITKIFSETTQNQPNETWEFHNCVLDKIDVNLKKFGSPGNIDEWILYSQTAQAFAMKFAVEIWRSRKFNNGGSLIWQYNEPWPTICWSLVDYYEIPKAAYWYTKNAFSPILITFNNDTREIILINDTFKTVSGALNITSVVLPGKMNPKKTIELSIKENRSKILNFPIDAHSENDILIMEFNSNIGNFSNFFFLSDPVNLKFDAPNVSYTINPDENTITFISDVFTFLVSISWKLRPQDNCFNLLPNVPHTVKVENLPEDKTNFFSSWTDHRMS